MQILLLATLAIILTQSQVMGLAAAPAPAVAQAGVFAFRSYGLEDGLGNLAVYAMAQGSDGFLWVATDDGVYRYDGHRFQAFSQGLGGVTAWDLAVSPEGLPWVNTSKGVFRYGPQGYRLAEGLPPGLAATICPGPGGATLVFAGKDLYGGMAGTAMTQVHAFPERIRYGWASRDLKRALALTSTQLWSLTDGVWSGAPLPPKAQGNLGRIFMDSRGRIWARGVASLWRKNPGEGPWQDLSGQLPGPSSNLSPPVEDALGRVWTSTTKGLLCVDGAESWVLDGAKGLPEGWAGPLLMDREGSLWVGSEGVHRLKGRFLWTGFGTHQGLPAATVWALGRGQDGRIYACTDRGVAILEGERFRTLAATLDHGITSMCRDEDDGLWLAGCTTREPCNIVFRLNTRTGRMEKFPVLGCSRSDHIIAVVSDGRGGVFLGTGQEGLFHLAHTSSGWKTESIFVGPGWPGRVNALLRDPEGRIWLAAEQGVAVLDDGAWHRLGKRNGLKDLNCWSLALDPGGRPWVSYSDVAGVSRLAMSNGEPQALDGLEQPAELFKDPVLGFAFDPKGCLWLSTSQGLKRWNGTQVECFGKGEGLPSQDPAANAIWVDPDGGVWQGFSNGIGHFDPRAWRGLPAAPEARLLEAADDRGPLPLGGGAGAIPYRDHTLAFQFSALTFLDEARVLHEVRLLGLEDQWRETKINEARYPALREGTYTFQVRSRYPEGRPGPVAGFTFQILPPWWNTWWCRSLGLLALLASLLGTIRWRTARLFRRNTLLERMVAQRTEALEASKADLERSNEALGKANLALEQASLVDPLTGLHNRRFLASVIGQEVAHLHRVFQKQGAGSQGTLPGNEDMVLFMLDLDHFKQVNDTFGHAAGDQVLQETAQLLRVACRASDLLVRWGGEEFLLVAKRTDRGNAPGIANKLCQALRDHTFLFGDGRTLKRTLSIGYAAFPLFVQQPAALAWEDTLKVADQCLYAAKHRGRDGWVGLDSAGTDFTQGLAERLGTDLEGLAREGVIQTRSQFHQRK